jgi:hypothetical protein
MMATEYTPNYNLDLYASADKPNLRDQYNAAMGKIDTQMKKSADDVTNANANVLTLQTQVTEAQKDISALESTVETHGTKITNVQKTANDALSLAQTNESKIETTQGTVTSLTSRVVAVEGTANKNKTDIASIDTRVGVAEGNITEAQNGINGLQTAVNQKAPINHASTANTYGQGSSTNFGHLKVADSGNAAASSGTAASPKMVTDQINALKSALAPTALIAATTVKYSGGISGSGTFSVYANSITKVVSVQLANTSLTTSGSGGWKSTVLGTIPTGYRPTRLMTQNCFSGWGFLYVDTNGQVRLEVSDSTSHSAGNQNGCALAYFGSK